MKEISEAELISSKGNSDLVLRLKDRCLYLRHLCKYTEDRRKQEKDQRVQDVGETYIRRAWNSIAWPAYDLLSCEY